MAVLHIRNSSGEFEEVQSLNGKTAYQAAKEGGYTGTESEFNTKLAQPEYSLPIATESRLGGVKPVTKSSNMTRAVGVDESGGLWTQPIELDETLTQTGQAADAAKTGEAIGQLKDDLDNITEKAIGINLIKNDSSLWESGSKDGVSGTTSNIYLTIPFTKNDFVSEIYYRLKLFILNSSDIQSSKIYSYIDLHSSDGLLIQKYYWNIYDRYDLFKLFEDNNATYGYIRLNYSSGISPSDIGNSIGLALGKEIDIDSLTEFVDYSESIHLSPSSFLDNSIGSDKLDKTINDSLKNIDSVSRTVIGYDLFSNVIDSELASNNKYAFFIPIPNDAGTKKYKCDKLNELSLSCSICGEEKTPIGSSVTINTDAEGIFEINFPLNTSITARYIRVQNGDKISETDKLNEIVHAKDLIEDTYTADIIFWGDSLTMGTGGNGITYPKKVSEILGLKCLNCGVGGETANTIACRQGGNNIVLPIGSVNRTFGKDELKDVFGDKVKPLLQSNGNGSGNVIFVNGQKCTLSYDSNGYTISGYDGEDLTVPTLATFNGSKYTAKFTVIFVGQNGSYAYGDTSINARIGIIDSMISHIGNNNYLILGLHTGSGDLYDPDSVKMLEHYGNRFFHTRKEMIENGLALAGLTPTTQDEEDISINKVPTSLLSDGIHFNSDGYSALGILVANRIKSYGIF